MNIKISSSQLMRLLSVCNSVIPSKPVLPILKDFLFTVEPEKITVAATDMEFSVVGHAEAFTSGVGKFTIQSEILVNTVRELPEQPLEIMYNPDTLEIEIVSSYGVYKTMSNDVDDYPDLTNTEKETTFEISAKRFINALNTCSFATSNDEMKASMTGIGLNFYPDSIIMAATDAHKLVKYTLFVDNGEVEASYILPKRIVGILKNLVNDDSPITIQAEPKNIFFKYNDFEVSSRLIEQSFPNYNAVIPANADKVILIDRLELLHALKRVKVYANKFTYQAVLLVENNEIKIEAVDPDFSTEANESIKCQYGGEVLDLTYNINLVIDSLSNLNAKEVKLSIAQPGRAGILTPNENEVGEEVLMLVMPVIKRRSYDE